MPRWPDAFLAHALPQRQYTAFVALREVEHPVGREHHRGALCQREVAQRGVLDVLAEHEERAARGFAQLGELDHIPCEVSGSAAAQAATQHRVIG